MARRLRLQFDQATRQSQSLRAQLAALCDRNTKPEGFVGITVSAEMTADAGRSGVRVFRFAENPTVETVEPGSPAERAGVTKGDEIILIGGQPVVGRDVLFTRLQRPGSRLPIRIRRDGDTRDVTLIVGEPLKSADNSCPFLDARIMAAFGDPFTVPTPMPPLGIVRVRPRNGVVIARSPAPTTPEAAPTPRRATGGSVSTPPPEPIVPSVQLPPPAQVWEPSVVTFPGTAPMVIAGATIIRTNADLRETFGVKSGVLVIDVARGTPAYNSGLRGGDIIVRAGRAAVTSPLSMQRAIQGADGSEVPLKIIRKKKERALVLRW
jgi:predicted metalloprotease with PDZ domain